MIKRGKNNFPSETFQHLFFLLSPLNQPKVEMFYYTKISCPDSEQHNMILTLFSALYVIYIWLQIHVKIFRDR